VEKKLNKDKDRMKEFQSIMEKYTGQYKDNKSKIERRDTILAFEQETEPVKNSAFRYLESTERLKEQKSRIADFIRQIRRLDEQEKQREESIRQEIEELEGQVAHLEYEKLSDEIYRIEENESSHIRNLEMLQMEQEDFERGREKLRHTLHLLDCAKQQEHIAECEEDRNEARERLRLKQLEEADLEPERERLGTQLKHFYEIQGAEKEAEQTKCSEAIAAMNREKMENDAALEELRESENALSVMTGALNEKIKSFDSVEDRFNQKYQEHWHRNILGEYEAGALPIAQDGYEKQLEETVHIRTKTRKELEQYKEQQKSLQRLLEEKNKDKIRLEAAQKETEHRLAEYVQELGERRVILKYFGMEEEQLFHTDKILETAQRKLEDTDRARQSLEKEAVDMEKEYRKLAQGEVLELPDGFSQLLEEAGIHYVYGMEWLKKNEYTPRENQELVKKHPFLPYSLILSGQELKRLSGLTEQVYTSFPVPILIREDLEGDGEENAGAVRSFGNLNFYVWFNDNLLDEEKLQQLLSEKYAEIDRKKQAIGQKKQEYTEYVEKQQKIKNQKVSKELYENAKDEIQRQEEERISLEEEIRKKREEQEQTETRQKQAEETYAELDETVRRMNGMLSDFKQLCREYDAYRENSRLKEKNQKEKERIENQKKLKREKIDRLTQKLISENNRMTVLEQEVKNCADKQALYRQYPKDTETPVLGEDEAKIAETRYEVITSGISAEQKDLEGRVATAEKRYDRAVDEQKNLQKKYRLSDGEWLGIRYDRNEESHQEALLKKQEEKIEEKTKQIHAEDKECTILREKKKDKFAELKERCGKESPVAKEEIQTLDFAEAIRTLNHQKGETEKQEDKIKKRLNEYDAQLTALAEYEEFVCEVPVEWEVDFSSMSGEELKNQKGTLIRDLNQYTQSRNDAKTDVINEIHRMMEMEMFKDDFYRKPLESLQQLTEDAGRILKQLDTTIASYHSLMEKLQVDISMVEKERAKIVELMSDYLKEVHENLNRIDHNSTITIRERAVKMLKIQLPDWAENESVYELRLQDYIEDVTDKGIALLEENKNVQEYLGTRLTTKALYDAVVGIGNVQIRLYKIEAQREYPITWAEVARNSGGEGFLSAFVILSALLYYMRRDETDIFADRNEGKVLLMDNPFAQTNAAHLLKPLMDMAKKTNTQLICLSGLGGESIYNCFDNIYVLKLIAANLRNDMQYLKAEHMRGSEEETMILSQIEVLEQQTLVF
jgi:hypothetical protein